MNSFKKVFLFLMSLTVSMTTWANSEVDTELLNSLKSEANHNYNRLKSFRTEQKNNSIYEEEREKAIAQFLEEQEKWDALREKGLSEFRRERKSTATSEDGPEYKEEQRQRRLEAEKKEKARQIQVATKQKARTIDENEIAELEADELGLKNLRPRFDLRKRGQNKWVKSGTGIGGRGGSIPSYNPNPVDSDAGFPPPPVDYIPAPPPVQEFEEIPPPPPPMYDTGSAMPYDAGFGDIPPPPPPPPPTEFDF